MSKLVKKIIFDLGAHKGEDTEYYLKNNFRVIAVEANIHLVKVIERKYKEYIDSNQLVLINAVIHNDLSEVKFYINNLYTEWGTANYTWVKRNSKLGAKSKMTKVSGINLEKLICNYGIPFYIKLDIEGSEYLCIEELLKLKIKPNYLSFELGSSSYKNYFNNFIQIINLRKIGYTKFCIVNQKKHNAKKRSKLNKGKPNYLFKTGSSGPFGRDLYNRKFSIYLILLLYILIVIWQSTLGLNTKLNKLFIKNKFMRKLLPGWYDLHAL